METIGLSCALRVVLRRLGLAALLAGGAVLIGCGGGTSPVVVRVGESTITKSALERWTNIEAAVTYDPNPTHAVPKGAIPDPPSFSNCVRYLRSRSTGAAKGAAALKRECAQQYLVLQHQILEILITSRWLTAEAKRLGLEVTDAEARRVTHKRFKTAAALHRFLVLTGETEADEVSLVKRTMQSNRLEASFHKPGVSPALATKAQVAFFTQMAKRWTSRTTCSRGYVIAQCREAQASG